MAEELLSLKWNNHQSHFMDILSFLREQEIFVDTTLACGGKLYAAHKFVLSTCSEYFKQMFIKNPTKHPIVFMKDVTSRDLEALLDFMYNGEVNVPQSSLGSLIKTAEGLQIKGLAVPDDPPVAKRDKDSIRDRHDKDHKSNIDRVHSPPPKRPRPRDRSSPQSSHVPGSLSRVRSPIPSSGPAESNVDEDSRTSVHSGISGHSEQTNVKSINIKSNVNNNSSNQFNSDNNPSLSSSENTVLNPLVDEPSPGPSGIQKHQSKVEEMEIKQEDVVDLGEDDDGDWGSGGGDGDALGDSSMGSDHNTSSFPDLMLPHNDGLSTSTDPAMWKTVASLRGLHDAVFRSGGTSSIVTPFKNPNMEYVGSHLNKSDQSVSWQDLMGANQFSELDGLSSSSSRIPDSVAWNSKGGQSWTCNVCNKWFGLKYYYERHMKCHQAEKDHICLYCPFRSTYKWNLKSHMRNRHSELLPPE